MVRKPVFLYRYKSSGCRRVNDMSKGGQIHHMMARKNPLKKNS